MSFPKLQNDLILRAARGEAVERPPMWIMRQAGRYLPEYHVVKGKRDFFECCRDAEIAAEITIQPIDHFDGLLDAAIIFSDILVIPQALGMEVEMVEGKGPSFPHPLRDVADVPALVSREVDVTKELAWAFKAITTTRHKLQGRVPLLGFCGAPWTLLVYMVEGGGTKMFRYAKEWIYKHPKESHAVLQKLATVAVDFLAHQVVAGAQMVQVFELWAEQLGPEEFAEFLLPYLKQIAAQLPGRLVELGVTEKIPVTVFAKGAWYALDALCDAGYNTVGLDWLYPPAQAVEVAKGRVVLQGNLDPGAIYGSRESITRKVEAMIAGFGGGKQGYIINFGHGTHPFMDPENVRWFLQECHRVGSQ